MLVCRRLRSNDLTVLEPGVLDSLAELVFLYVTYFRSFARGGKSLLLPSPLSLSLSLFDWRFLCTNVHFLAISLINYQCIGQAIVLWLSQRSER